MVILAAKQTRLLPWVPYTGHRLGLLNEQNLKFATSQVLRHGVKANTEAADTRSGGDTLARSACYWLNVCIATCLLNGVGPQTSSSWFLH